MLVGQVTAAVLQVAGEERAQLGHCKQELQRNIDAAGVVGVHQAAGQLPHAHQASAGSARCRCAHAGGVLGSVLCGSEEEGVIVDRGEGREGPVGEHGARQARHGLVRGRSDWHGSGGGGKLRANAAVVLVLGPPEQRPAAQGQRLHW